MNGRGGHVRARIAAQGAWEPRLFGNDGALITRRAIYTEPRRGIAFSRRNCSRPDRRRGSKRLPLSFLLSFPSLLPLFPSLPDPRGGEGAKIRRDDRASIYRRGNCPAEAKRGRRRGSPGWKMCIAGTEMGIPAVYFPRCLSWPRSNGGGTVGRYATKYWISINSLAARSNDWFREFRRI